MFIPSILSALFCLGLGIFVVYRNPKRKANLWFALGMGSLAVTEFSAFMMGIRPNLQSVYFWQKVATAGEALLPGSWLLFSLTFARSNTAMILTKWRSVVALFWFVPLGFLGFLGSSEFVYMPSVQYPSQYLLINMLGYSFYVFLLLSLVVVMMNIEQTFRTSSGITRWQIKFMIVGTGAILAYKIYEAGQILLFSSIQLNSIPIRAIALLMASALILFAVVRHRLLDVDLFISRYVLYNSITLLAAGLYLLLVGLTVYGVQRFDKEGYLSVIPLLIFASLLGLVLLFLSERLRWKVKTFISIHFYKNKHDYRIKWQEFTKAVGTKINLSELLPSYIGWLADTIGTNEVALWLWDPTREVFCLSGCRGFTSAPAFWSEDSKLIQHLKEQGAPVTQDETNSTWGLIIQEHPEFFSRNNAAVWVPMRSGREMMGFVVLGEKITRDGYDYLDLELLMTIADQSAGQIHRVRVNEELSLAREMETFHMLSSFFIHDLKNYTSSLSLVAQNASAHAENPEFQKDAISTIRDTAEKMNRLIRRLAVVSKRTLLSWSEIDLNRLVEIVLTDLNGSLKGRIHSRYGDLPRILADHEQLSIVLRNLLINASEATNKKGDVTIETRSEKNWIYLSVSDNGCGMSEEFIIAKLFKPLRSTKATGWGIGLFQCQQIIQAHGGKIEVKSREGKGSTFTVVLPVKRV